MNSKTINYLIFFYLINFVFTINNNNSNRKLNNGIDIVPYIMGGRDATIEEVPWQVAITDHFHELKCGGTIIHSEWIVTSALCLDDLT